MAKNPTRIETIRGRKLEPFLERGGKGSLEEDVDSSERIEDIFVGGTHITHIKTKNYPSLPRMQSFSIRLSSCLTEDDCNQNSAY